MPSAVKDIRLISHNEFIYDLNSAGAWQQNDLCSRVLCPQVFTLLIKCVRISQSRSVPSKNHPLNLFQIWIAIISITLITFSFTFQCLENISGNRSVPCLRCLQMPQHGWRRVSQAASWLLSLNPTGSAPKSSTSQIVAAKGVLCATFSWRGCENEYEYPAISTRLTGLF